MSSKEVGSFSISRKDWSLHRKAPIDVSRHDEKIKEVIRENLPDIIGDYDIITSDPDTKQIVRIPMRTLELPRIRYGDPTKGIGSGEGKKPGDILGQIPKKGEGNEPGAGDQPGEEGYYEVEYDILELAFEELGLPYLKPKQTADLEQVDIIYDRLRKKKQLTNIDITRTVLENMKRNAKQKGQVVFGDLKLDDLVNRDSREKPHPSTNALLILMADNSGSIGKNEQYIIRITCRWILGLLRRRYQQVEVLLINHTSDAREVDEKAFFSQNASGGTICSSANELALKIIHDRFPVSQYNIYPLHFSDGDNLSSDNDHCVNTVKALLELGVNQYAYFQIGRNNYGMFSSNLYDIYKKKIQHERFHALSTPDKKDIYPALQEIFNAELNE